MCTTRCVTASLIQGDVVLKTHPVAFFLKLFDQFIDFGQILNKSCMISLSVYRSGSHQVAFGQKKTKKKKRIPDVVFASVCVMGSHHLWKYLMNNENCQNRTI